MQQTVQGLALAAALVLVSLAGIADAQQGIQLTPDSARYLISKDVPVGNGVVERWAITLNNEDRTATGNIFKTDGSPPGFIWCAITNISEDPDPAEIEYTLLCYGSDACSAQPCSAQDWNFVGAPITIKGDFMLPPDTRSTLGGNVQPILSAKCASPACHAGSTPSADLNLEDGASWAALFAVPAAQAQDKDLVDPFHPDASYLVDKIIGEGVGSMMPLGGAPLSASEVESIRRWIREGAVDN